MDDEDSFYSAAAHAVGDDGSSQAKETVRRDLDAAAAAYMQVFKGDDYSGEATTTTQTESSTKTTRPARYADPDCEVTNRWP